LQRYAAAEMTDTPPPEGRPRHRKRRFAIWLAVVAGFAIVLVWLLRGGGEQPKKPPPTPPVAVETVAAKTADLPIFIDAIGTVTPVQTAQIASQVTGRVIAVHYKEGQLVHAGDPLVDIDPRPFQAALLQAQGTLEHDTHLLAQAKMDLERFRLAWAKRAIAKQQLDDQEKLVLQTQGTVKADQGAVDIAKVNLDYTKIVAPITGRVGLRLVDPGNLVTATGGTTLAVITQLQPITVVFAISEDNLSEVLGQPNHGAGLDVDVYDRLRTKKLATGRLITIDNQIDTTTGTVRLRAVFDNTDEALFPNQFVNTRLLVTTRKNVTLVPSVTIRHDGELSFVYVIDNGRARVQKITVGATEGDQTEVIGIAPGTVVASSSFEKLRDGAPVTVSPPPRPTVGRTP
jgi:membrane fusion protein, multidrug efflux system